MRIVDRAEVQAALAPAALIEAVGQALADVSAGRASMPPRIGARTELGLLGAMAGHAPSLDTLAAKLVSVFPGNRALPTHQAVVVVFDPRTGEPLALLDGTEITAQRTAAASALATRLLAREDARVLAIVGAGVQARSHARYLVLARRFREVVVAARNPEQARALAAEIPGARAAGIEEAVRAADVVCATTHAQEPVVRAAWLKPGAHVNSVGVNPEGSELDPAILSRALLAVESRAAAFAPYPAGAFELRAMDPARAVELGELFSGTGRGRESEEQITLYKSVGVAVEDAAAAALVLRAGAGTSIPLEGRAGLQG